MRSYFCFLAIFFFLGMVERIAALDLLHVFFQRIYPIRSCSCFSKASARFITDDIASCSESLSGLGLHPYFSYNSAFTDHPIRNLPKNDYMKYQFT